MSVGRTLGVDEDLWCAIHQEEYQGEWALTRSLVRAILLAQVLTHPSGIEFAFRGERCPFAVL